MAEAREYQIDRQRVARYLFWSHLLTIAAVGLCLFGIGVVAAPIFALTLGRWLPKKQAEVLRYRLFGSTIRIDQGVFFLKRKAIPLDRVTDVALVQGPLMRRCGVWALQIQTAGTGFHQGGLWGAAEGVMHGLRDPEAVRDELLAARDDLLAARDAAGAGRDRQNEA